MLNQCILVGKVISISKENKDVVITLSIARSYKEPGEEEYCIDELDIELSDHLSKTALEYLNEGATVGVKARIKSSTIELEKESIKMHKIMQRS